MSVQAAVTPLVSVVVPAHNRERFLATTLQSIRDQTFTDWEAVIVDDGSRDGTLAIAERFAAIDRRFKVVLQAQAGVSAARNAGFRASSPTSSYVTFMDSDDVWLPDALERLLATLAANPDAIGSHGLGEYIDADGNRIAVGEYAAYGRDRRGLDGDALVVFGSDRPTTFEILVYECHMFPPGVLLARRDAYLAAGPYDSSLDPAEDADMAIRLSRLGDFAFADAVILLYRQHGSNGGQGRHAHRQGRLLLSKTFYSPQNTPAQQALRRTWRAHQGQALIGIPAKFMDAVRRRDLLGCLRQIYRIPLVTIRVLRGHPLPRVHSQPLRW